MDHFIKEYVLVSLYAFHTDLFIKFLKYFNSKNNNTVSQIENDAQEKITDIISRIRDRLWYAGPYIRLYVNTHTNIYITVEPG